MSSWDGQSGWDPKESLGFLINDTARQLTNAFDKRLAPLGLTRSQWRVIIQLMRNDGMTQSELAELLGVGKVTIGGLVDRLEQKGLIERQDDPSDRRIRRVFLRAAAEPTLERIAAAGDELRERALAGIDEDERTQLFTLLEVVKRNSIDAQAEAEAAPVDGAPTLGVVDGSRGKAR